MANGTITTNEWVTGMSAALGAGIYMVLFFPFFVLSCYNGAPSLLRCWNRARCSETWYKFRVHLFIFCFQFYCLFQVVQECFWTVSAFNIELLTYFNPVAALHTISYAVFIFAFLSLTELLLHTSRNMLDAIGMTMKETPAKMAVYKFCSKVCPVLIRVLMVISIIFTCVLIIVDRIFYSRFRDIWIRVIAGLACVFVVEIAINLVLIMGFCIFIVIALKKTMKPKNVVSLPGGSTADSPVPVAEKTSSVPSSPVPSESSPREGEFSTPRTDDKGSELKPQEIKDTKVTFTIQNRDKMQDKKLILIRKMTIGCIFLTAMLCVKGLALVVGIVLTSVGQTGNYIYSFILTWAIDVWVLIPVLIIFWPWELPLKIVIKKALQLA